MLSWPAKDPDEVLDYQIDWSARLLTDTVQSSVWTLPAGITKESDSFTTTNTIIWLSGGTLAATYDLLNRIETTGGRTMDQTVRIKIKAK